mmetsp:Transcript_11608/g.30003  ORF Transcript_11608/g.30003 Transcript_11608/m.30003 type:complete len:327 (+) Transcript_11608:2052-3032(+)
MSSSTASWRATMPRTVLSGCRSHCLSKRWPGPEAQWSSWSSRVPSFPPSLFSTISKLARAEASRRAVAVKAAASSLSSWLALPSAPSLSQPTRGGMPSLGTTLSVQQGKTAWSSMLMRRKSTRPPSASRPASSFLSFILSTARAICGGTTSFSDSDVIGSSEKALSVNLAESCRSFLSIPLVSLDMKPVAGGGVTTSTGRTALRKVLSLDRIRLSSSWPTSIRPVVTSTADTPTSTTLSPPSSLAPPTRSQTVTTMACWGEFLTISASKRVPGESTATFSLFTTVQFFCPCCFRFLFRSASCSGVSVCSITTTLWPLLASFSALLA